MMRPVVTPAPFPQVTAPREKIEDAMDLPGFEWLPGMLTSSGWRILDVQPRTPEGFHLIAMCDGVHRVFNTVDKRSLPGCIDVFDPATAGCLLMLCGGHLDIGAEHSVVEVSLACVEVALKRRRWSGRSRARGSAGG